MKSVIVLGASGMLGSLVVDFLSQQSDLSVTATVRSHSKLMSLESNYPKVDWIYYDAENAGRVQTQFVARHQWTVNCVGITKPFIHENSPSEIERAIRVNALWPNQLANAIDKAGNRLLSIATDCVFSGKSGPYAEPSTSDAHDVYGRTKSLGESKYNCCTNLRTSIIGPEQGPSKFLLEWVRRQPQGAKIKGFVDHHWNGITTLAFAKICLGIIRQTGPALTSNLTHVVPKDIVTKYTLLNSIARAYGREDITIDPLPSPHANMVLSTHQPYTVDALWAAAGYSERPTIEALVQECASYQFQ